jgi:hypothetical protein
MIAGCEKGDKMKTLKLSALISMGVVLCIVLASGRFHADSWNKKTILTVNETITIPGALLTPGKYVFKLLDSQSDRHIVQVFNEDETFVIATIMAIPNERSRPRGKSEFSFWEMPVGTPPALRSWFYPGDNQGQEFAYPKETARRIWTNAHEYVPIQYDEDLERFSSPPSQEVPVPDNGDPNQLSSPPSEEVPFVNDEDLNQLSSPPPEEVPAPNDEDLNRPSPLHVE